METFYHNHINHVAYDRIFQHSIIFTTGQSEEGCFRQGKKDAVLNDPCGILTKYATDISLRPQGTISTCGKMGIICLL